MTRVTGKVIANFKKGKDRNWIFIASNQFGREPVRAVLDDDDAKDITWNDYIQLSGKTRRRCRKLDDGTVVKNVLLMRPLVERVIHLKTLNNTKGKSDYDNL